MYGRKDTGISVQEEEEDSVLPPERNVMGEEPKIGVFICDCGENIGSVVDVDSLVEHAKHLQELCTPNQQDTAAAAQLGDDQAVHRRKWT